LILLQPSRGGSIVVSELSRYVTDRDFFAAIAAADLNHGSQATVEG
jgi:hypothetical protein